MALLALAARLILGAYFLRAGIDKFVHHESVDIILANFTLPIADKSLPWEELAVWLTAGLEVAGGFALIVGYATRFAAFLFAGFTIAVSVVLYHFWDAPPEIAPTALTLFMKNMTTLAALLLLMGFGAGPISYDGRHGLK